MTLTKFSPLLLASSSPRRRELCLALGLPIATVAPEVDERISATELPDEYLERVVSAKLRAAGLSAQQIAHGALLVADTIVVCEGEILDKPRDFGARVDVIRRLQGRAHEVKTRFAIQRADDSAMQEATVVTRVFVRPLSARWVDAYAHSGEGSDKAGGYAIQGRFACAIPRIEGSYSNVVGLPQAEVWAALELLGLVPAFPSQGGF